ncbi:hypothetical protein CMO90_00520 [Candidatus Woesearchaeota archaeon]|jgi:ribonuclease P/MRP protein subunit POP5|nr:hypothetical protein [Candidatus Woesearchaeota archaeon]
MVKQLLPSLKEKKRYVVYEIMSKKKFKNMSREIVKKANSFLGLFESAEAGLQNIDFNEKMQRGVLRVGVNKLDKLKMSLALINKLNDEEVTLHTIGVSGILKKAKNKYMAG